MTQRRAHALALLETIRSKLARSGAVNLNSEERDYLASVCAEALAGAPDPLRLSKGAGGQDKRAEALPEAAMVHKLVKAGATIRAACERVGAELNRDGAKSGAVEKNYKVFRAELEAVDRVYAARAAGEPPRAADFEAILRGK